MSLAEPPTSTLVAVNPGDRIQWGAPGNERTGTVVASSGLRHVVNPDDGPQTSIENCAFGLKVLQSAALARATPAELATPLTDAERAELEECEQVIREGRQTFLAVGERLVRVSSKRLYRETHNTFEDYCREKWEFSRPYAYQLMAASEVHGHLSASGIQNLPESERALRPLATLEPEDQVKAAERAAELAGEGKVTSSHTAQAADEIRFDYSGWEVGDEIWWIDSAENVRHGVVEQCWQGRLMTRTTDGGRETQLVAVDPPAARERDAKAPAATPFGVCEEPPLHNSPAVAPDRHSYGVKLCESCLGKREAAQRVAEMSAAAGLQEHTSAIATAAGLQGSGYPASEVWPDGGHPPVAPEEQESVEAVPATSMGPADQAAADASDANVGASSAAPVPSAAEIAARRAEERTQKSGALKSAEEKVAERKAAAAEPPKPQPVNFPIMPDLAERIKASGIGTLPAIRFGLALAERAQQQGTEAHLLLKDYFDVDDLCLANVYGLREVVAAGIAALDAAAAAGEGGTDA